MIWKGGPTFGDGGASARAVRDMLITGRFSEKTRLSGWYCSTERKDFQELSSSSWGFSLVSLLILNGELVREDQGGADARQKWQQPHATGGSTVEQEHSLPR